MRQGRIVIISGPSGSGKTTLHQKLLASPVFKGRLIKSISATTRPRRSGERNGRDYLFLTRRMFRYRIRTGQFLEWQKVFDNYYGTPIKNVKKLLKNGKHVLLCIDVKGAKVVGRHCPEALKIFINPPSLSVLKDRLEKRGLDTPQSVALRLRIASREMREARHYDYRIVNRDLRKAGKDLEMILRKELAMRP